MQPDMVFNHGSNGKVLTAWGVMKLVEHGQGRSGCAGQPLLEALADRSDEFDATEVTVRRLLSHTGA